MVERIGDSGRMEVEEGRVDIDGKCGIEEGQVELGNGKEKVELEM